MGLFTPSNRRPSTHHSHSHSHSHSSHHRPSSTSNFWLGGASSSNHRPTPSVFSRHSSSSSSYRRRPRDGYISYLLNKFTRLLRDLLRWARRHPVRVILFVVMPLLSGGALHGLARQFGLRLPAVLGLGGGAARSAFGSGYYGSAGYGGSGFGSGGFGLESVGGMGSLLKVVQAFM